jgi:hypothetical protein
LRIAQILKFNQQLAADLTDDTDRTSALIRISHHQKACFLGKLFLPSNPCFICVSSVATLFRLFVQFLYFVVLPLVAALAAL